MRPTPIVRPEFEALMWLTLEALEKLGGSGAVRDIEEQVYQSGDFSEDQRNELHRGGPMTELAYRLAWVRTYLKRVGAVENSRRGVWSVTDRGRLLTLSDMAAIPGQVQAQLRAEARGQPALESDDLPISGGATDQESEQWKEELLRVLLEMDPGSFQRLAQRMLREQGLLNVTVTGRTGDGGIDGTGILRLNLISFPMFFQCKRYRGSVGAPAIRDFRGAMVGRSDKGVFITTGHFTADAVKEASRDGAPPVDLVDGEQLCMMLKDLRLGVETKLVVTEVEQVLIDPNWFRAL